MVCCAKELVYSGKRDIAEKICPYPERLSWASCWKCGKSDEQLKREAQGLEQILEEIQKKRGEEG